MGPIVKGVDSENQADPFNQLRPKVYQLTGIRRLLGFATGAIIRSYLKTLRIQPDPESAEALAKSEAPRVIVVWHNRSLVIPEVFYRLLDPSKIHCLISPSRQAAWEVDFFSRFGLKSIRGSTTRRSIQAAMEMLRALRRGDDVGLSPDGPSGPLYSFQAGALTIARKADVPLLLLVPNAQCAIRLRTWDRHLLPLPFAMVKVKAHLVPPSALSDMDTETAIAYLRTLCLELTDDPFQVN